MHLWSPKAPPAVLSWCERMCRVLGLARSSCSTTPHAPTSEAAGPSLPGPAGFQHIKCHDFDPCHKVASQDAGSLCPFYESKPSRCELRCSLSQSLTINRKPQINFSQGWRALGLRANGSTQWITCACHREAPQKFCQGCRELLSLGSHSFQGTPGTSSPHAACPAPSPVIGLSHG